MQKAMAKHVVTAEAFGGALETAIDKTEWWAISSREELAKVASYVQAFMQKLQTLSEEYEMEKSALERNMFQSLNESTTSTTTEIVEQRASARHYVSLVNEYQQKTQGILMEGIQARRECEKKFTKRLLEVTKTECEHVVVEMRSEDRKKAQFERSENSKKLENCRTAVRLDLAAMLLQQRSALDRQKKEEIAQVEKQLEALKKETVQKLAEMQAKVVAANDRVKHTELDMKVAVSNLNDQVFELKDQHRLDVEDNNRLYKEVQTLEEKAHKLQEEVEIVKDELVSTERSYEEQIKELNKRLNRKDEEMQRKEARLMKRCEEIMGDLNAKSHQVEELKTEKQLILKEKEVLEDSLSSMRAEFAHDKEMWEEEREQQKLARSVLETKIEDLQSDIRGKEASLRRLQSEVAEYQEKVDKLHAQISQMEDEKSKIVRLFRELREEVYIWLLDNIYLRQGFDIDPGFDGTEESVASIAEEFASLDHKDLQALFNILQGNFAGTYCSSNERTHVGKMTYFQNKARLLQPAPGDLVSMEKGSSRSSSIVPEFGSATNSVLASLNAAEKQRELDAQIEQLQEEHKTQMKKLSAEWRAKTISLAERLKRTEAEIELPRAEDLTQIKQLESQIRSLVQALKEAKDSSSQAQAKAPVGRSSSNNIGDKPNNVAPPPISATMPDAAGRGGKALSRSATPHTDENEEFRMEDFNRWLDIPVTIGKKKGQKTRAKGSKGNKLSNLVPD